MTSFPTLRLATLAGLGSLACLPVLAQTDTYADHYGYGGVSAGGSRSHFDEQRVTNTLLGPGVTTTAIGADKKDTAVKLFGGYQFNRHFALEGGYFNLGRFGYTATTSVPLGTLSGKARLQGINMDAVGLLPLSTSWSLLGRVGVQYAQTRDSFTTTGALVATDPNVKKNKTNVKYGFGLQYAITPHVLVRTELERYRINDAVGNNDNVNTLTVGLIIPFGRGSAPAPRAVPAPEPVVMMQEPTPPPAVVAVAPPPPVAVVPERRRVSFSAESLYSFDQAALRPEGKTALDGFAKELAGTRFDMINVEGHTDRLGTPAYNQRLSLQRADAVKSYLVSNGQVDAAKITAVGKGETTPVTKPEDCKGNKATKALIACLQPDRRVDIEVVGTR